MFGRIAMVATLVLPGVGCGPTPQPPAPADSVGTGRVFSGPRRPVGWARFGSSSRFDMEGLSGQSDWRTFSAGHPDQFVQGQRLLAADVNAVVDGLFAGGATAVDVFDQHVSGQPDSISDLPPALLDRRAHEVFMSEGMSEEIAAKGRYDALATSESMERPEAADSRRTRSPSGSRSRSMAARSPRSSSRHSNGASSACLDFRDGVVSFDAPSLGPVAFAQMVAIIGLAGDAGRFQLLQERLLADPAGRALLRSNEDAHTDRWLDFESGRWKPAGATPR